LSFKKRYTLKFRKPGIIFGDFTFTLCKSYNMEYIYLYNFKKSLKKYYNFKKTNTKVVWLFLHKNYPLTKKSKNARMGKGKGSIARYCARIEQNHNLLEFSGFNLCELIRLRKIFNKKVCIPVNILGWFFKSSHTTLYSKNENMFYSKKYFK